MFGGGRFSRNRVAGFLLCLCMKRPYDILYEAFLCLILLCDFVARIGHIFMGESFCAK